MTDEQTDALVDFILAARSEFLSNGAKALSHWDQLHTRLLAAARSGRDVATFVTRVGAGLRLGAPRPERALATEHLRAVVSTDEVARWLREIPQEAAFIMAAARLRADQRREARRDDGQIDLFGFGASA
jgi:hypothetical protein